MEKKKVVKDETPRGWGLLTGLFENGIIQTICQQPYQEKGEQRSSLEWYALLTLFMLLF